MGLSWGYLLVLTGVLGLGLELGWVGVPCKCSLCTGVRVRLGIPG